MSCLVSLLLQPNGHNLWRNSNSKPNVMKSVCKFFCILILILNAFNQVSLQLLSEDVCNSKDSPDAEALSRWYAEIYKFANNNQNVTQQLINLNEKLEETQKELKQQQINQNLQISELKEQLSKMEQLINKLADPSPHSSKNEIVIQRRQDGSVDFFRNWNEYKEGFGNSSGEFFIGLEKLYKLTNTRPYALLIVMEDWKGGVSFAHYDSFAIGSETQNYKLKELGKYSGTAGDSLEYHRNQPFSTKDRENDYNQNEPCADLYKGGWWYTACHKSNLNGLYLKDHVGENQWAQGIHWFEVTGHYETLKFVEMILVRKN